MAHSLPDTPGVTEENRFDGPWHRARGQRRQPRHARLAGETRSIIVERREQGCSWVGLLRPAPAAASSGTASTGTRSGSRTARARSCRPRRPPHSAGTAAQPGRRR